jgi:hypothetical protein
MFSDVMKYNRHGRTRFASAVLINNEKEQIVETVEGVSRQYFVFTAMLILLFIKILSANFFGFILSFLLFLTIFFGSTLRVKLIFTKRRLLKVSEFRYPLIIRTFGIILFIWTIYSLFKGLFPAYIPGLDLGLNYFYSLFQMLGISESTYFNYENFYYQYKPFLIRTEAFISLFVNFYIALNFYFISYSFTEIHHKKITELLISIKQPLSFPKAIILLFALISLILIFNGFNIFVIALLIALNYYFPGSDMGVLQLYSKSGRKLHTSIILPKAEFKQFTRTIGAIFGWSTHKSMEVKNFPSDIIPNTIASHYDTGLQASLSNALNYGNKLGALIAIVTNIVVSIALFRFAFTYNSEALPTVLGILLAQVLSIIIVWLILKQFSKIRVNMQQNEKLIIGSDFVGRYLPDNLWIIKSNQLAGKQSRNRFIDSFYRFDRVSGLTIAWQKITIYAILFFITAILAYWVSIGALNVRSVFLIFPFLLDLGFEFLTQKLSAELNFFIISSFVLWIIIYSLFPRFYSNTRPQFIVKSEHLSRIPVIFKNHSDLEDASVQFSKSLINSSQLKHKEMIPWPGYFIIDMVLKGVEWGDAVEFHTILLEFGENRRKAQSIEIVNYKGLLGKVILSNLSVSAEFGYPSIETRVSIIGEDGVTKLTNISLIEFEYFGHKTYEIKILERTTISIIFRMKKIIT